MAYLGTSLASDGTVDAELSRRIGCAKADFRTLSKLWSHSSLTGPRKLKVYQSIIETKLLYGLACCCLTIAQQRRLNGFQCKCLRKIMGIKLPFISHIPNVEVYRRSGHIPATKILAEIQLQMLGKIRQSPQRSQLHAATFMAGTTRSACDQYVRRVGRPRKEWLTTVLEYEGRREQELH